MAHEDNTVKRDENTGDVVEVNVDEVIVAGDPRHGVHDPLPPERDSLAVHAGKTPEQIFGTPSLEERTVTLPESDLDGADGRRGPVVRTVTDSGVTATPEQVFTDIAVAEAVESDDSEAVAKAEAAKADADAKAKADDGAGSRNSG